MKTNSPVEQPDARALADAVSRGALDQADAMLASLPTPLRAELLPAVVELHVRRHRWIEALACISQMGEPSGDRLEKLDRALRHDVEQYYSKLRAEELAEVLSTDRPRKPRVLLLATDGSDETARETTEAFAQIGCESRLIVLPAVRELCSLAITVVLDGFRPDVIFQIDRLGRQHGGLFPANLPVASWLLSPSDSACGDAAGSIRARDFVLCAQPSRLITLHGFPSRQMIHLPMLARVPIRPTHWESRGDDLAYVSNASQTSERALEELRGRWKDSGEIVRLVDHVTAEVVRLYDTGSSIATHAEMRGLIEAGMEHTGVHVDSPATMRQLIESIFDTLNRTLHREQTLGWAADVAMELGLTFAIYGAGWDKHPTFATHARPATSSPPAREDLARSTRVNLHIEPYALFTRGRLLAGLFAGGFFLVRDHPFNRLSQELVDCLVECGCASAETKHQAIEMVDPALRPKLEAIFDRCRAMEEHGDCVALVRDFERSRILVAGEESLPRMNEISFSSRATLKRCIQHFLSNDDARHQIVYEQRLSTENRLSYATGLRRLLREMSDRIAAEAAEPEIRKCA